MEMPKVQHGWVWTRPILDSLPQSELCEVRNGEERSGAAPDFIWGVTVVSAGPQLRTALLQAKL